MTSWYDEPEPVTGPVCGMDGTIERSDGSEFYWHCGQPGAITVDRALLCEDHAGELGYGPKQEEYGYDPDDGHNPAPDAEAERLARLERED